jgi:hypothetical protein
VNPQEEVGSVGRALAIGTVGGMVVSAAFKMMAEVNDFRRITNAASAAEQVSAAVAKSTPGVATISGELRVAGAGWLNASQPAAIPLQIAEKLRGRTFSNLNEFRGAFWEAVAADPELSSGFTLLNRNAMANGEAPFAPAEFQSSAAQGGMRFNIHHRQAVEDGGPVYDMSNMVIVSPNSHSYIHYDR